MQNRETLKALSSLMIDIQYCQQIGSRAFSLNTNSDQSIDPEVIANFEKAIKDIAETSQNVINKLK